MPTTNVGQIDEIFRARKAAGKNFDGSHSGTVNIVNN